MGELQTQHLHDTDDAVVWAESFVQHVRENPSIATDEAIMIGWFANAICAAWDCRARREAARQKEAY